MREWQTSYVKVPPEESGCRRVTFEITPLADRMQIARGPCCENDITFMVTSLRTIERLQVKWTLKNQRSRVKLKRTVMQKLICNLSFHGEKQRVLL